MVVDEVADVGELAGGVIVVVAEGGVDGLCGESVGESGGEILHNVHVDCRAHVIVGDVCHSVPGPKNKSPWAA